MNFGISHLRACNDHQEDAALITSEADIPAFSLHQPPNPQPIIISLPHGGHSYPSGIVKDKSQLAAMRTLEDLGTNHLFAPLCQPEFQVISANLSRAIIDLNRPADALDPLLYQEAVPETKSAGGFQRYVQSGYGVMPRLSAKREALYQAKLSLQDAQRLISCFYEPYHAQLSTLLKPFKENNQNGLLVDIHSMPSHYGGNELPDFIFGDCFGRSASPDIRQSIDQFMKQTGFSHRWNYPYAGGYITAHYGHLQGPIEGIQIEINRALYLKKQTQISHQALRSLAGFLRELIQHIAQEQMRAEAAE